METVCTFIVDSIRAVCSPEALPEAKQAPSARCETVPVHAFFGWPEHTALEDEYDWPVGAVSIDDADEQFTRLQRSHAAARATYSILVRRRHEAAERISSLKQAQARQPAAVYDEKMRDMVCDYKKLELDVSEARNRCSEARRVKITARSNSVAVFKKASRSASPVRTVSPIRAPSGDGVTRERKATLRSMSPTRIAKAAPRLPSTSGSSVTSGSSAASSSAELQFRRTRSSS